MIQIDVTDVQFESIADDKWKMNVIIKGSGFVFMGRPIAAQVGDIPVQVIMQLFDGSGIVGAIDTIPAHGDKVFVGYMDSPLMETQFSFELPPNA